MANKMASNNSNYTTTSNYLAQERSQNIITPPGSRSNSLSGVKDADFVAIGLGGTVRNFYIRTACETHTDFVHQRQEHAGDAMGNSNGAPRRWYRNPR